MDQLEAEQIQPLWQWSTEIGTAIVDLLSFGTGRGYITIIDRLEMPDGKTGIPDFFDPRLAALCNFFDDGAKVAQAVELMVSDGNIRRALHDLVQCLSWPDVAPINCARAVEAIRHRVAGPQQRGDQWKILRERLNIDKSYLDLIINISKERRHGNRITIAPGAGSEATVRSWTIMHRFIDYLFRGESPLPLDQFPILSA